MGQYSKLLLLAEDSGEPTPAFIRAVGLARATGATLHIAAFCSDPLVDEVSRASPALQARLRDAYLRERQQALHRLVDPARDRGIAIHLDLVPEPPHAEAMLARVVALAPDLVIKDARHDSALRRFLLKPLDWQLANLCPAPLWLVNGGARQLPSRIVAAVDSRAGDGESLNDEVVRGALDLARQCDAEAILAHVALDTTALPSGGMFGEAGLVTAYNELVLMDGQRFKALARKYGVPGDRQHVVAGAVAPALAELAHDAEGDVLVIGAARRSGLERFFLGRTATDVLEASRCDVLVVKPAGFGEALRAAA